ncbi:DUF2163 domain-containing protein [Jannaschia sp. M317]|uniref:DUF2163 domain-containing protein n=1 Tax=Jannaschia sp. M317 TaxID=2867011 RepID=UPI0021A91DC5|nr:DUF2163 domain-containing protein [Jannaschia sp. M317]UWQ16983.1 DUF2163 domain-containing protein [Jannaschia sp. M317]
MSALADHLAIGTSTVCRAWVLRRKDGIVHGFTDHDRDMIVDGVACLASSGMAAGALQASTGMAVDNVEASGALQHDVISEADLKAGRWDAAEVTAYLVNWQDPGSFEILFRGSLGEISWGDGRFSAELRGLAEALNKTQGRVFQSRCDAVLGDGRCRKDLSDDIFTLEVEVVEVEDARVLFLPIPDLYEARWFERGRLDVLDGAASGLSEQVKTDRIGTTSRRIELWAGLRAPIAAGDRVRLQAGCDKRMATCRFKFDNLLNFRGFPHIPGDDWMMAYPNSRAVNDGGKR